MHSSTVLSLLSSSSSSFKPAMVTLTLSSPKGNQGNKSFPFTGYLGLTPIRLEGGQSFHCNRH